MAKTTNPRQSFRARLEPDESRLRWVVVRLPFTPAEVWPVRRRQRVCGEINGVAFRTSLFPDPRGSGQVLLVNKKIQDACGVGVGSTVEIWLEPDLEERSAELPEELDRILRGNKGLWKWLMSMSESMRREIGKWVAEPATAATREKRAEQMGERLMLAMEGEKELPPILRVAFARNPLAERGWQLLTPTQRRNHLLGIFYYQSTEARERRVQKAVDEAERVAGRKWEV